MYSDTKYLSSINRRIIEKGFISLPAKKILPTVNLKYFCYQNHLTHFYWSFGNILERIKAIGLILWVQKWKNGKNAIFRLF